MKNDINNTSLAMEIVKDLKNELILYKILTSFSIIGIAILLIIIVIQRG